MPDAGDELGTEKVLREVTARMEKAAAASVQRIRILEETLHQENLKAAVVIQKKSKMVKDMMRKNADKVKASKVAHAKRAKHITALCEKVAKNTTLQIRDMSDRLAEKYKLSATTPPRVSDPIQTHNNPIPTPQAVRFEV